MFCGRMTGPCTEASALAAVQMLEDKLRALEHYLREYQERRRLAVRSSPSARHRPVQSGGYMDDAGRGDPPAKRQKLAEAAKLEDQRWAMAPSCPQSCKILYERVHCTSCNFLKTCCVTPRLLIGDATRTGWCVGVFTSETMCAASPEALAECSCRRCSCGQQRASPDQAAPPSITLADWLRMSVPMSIPSHRGHRVSGLRALVTRAAEGTFLIRLLSEHNLGRLAARSDEHIRCALREPLRLRDWVCSASGEAAASGLISLLISEHLTASGARCPDILQRYLLTPSHLGVLWTWPQK